MESDWPIIQLPTVQPGILAKFTP